MLVLLLALQAARPDTVRYEISFANAVHHEARVTATFSAPANRPLEVRMSRSSPGRYALHEFAKNVYDVSATDGRGRAVRLSRKDSYSWLVTGHNGTVRFTYTVYADRGDGTYAQFDRTHAHMNMPAVFAWAVGHDRTPISIKFTVPSGSDWKVATQLIPTRNDYVFRAPDLQYFMDSPTEVSDFKLRSWTIAGPAGRVDTIRMAMHHLGTDAELDEYVEMAKKVVAEEVAVYGETARYDHRTYTFLADYLPWVSGDGMEHRNSTIISSTGSLARSKMGLLGTLAHEFFHSWNIERIRPRALEPFNFFQANPSDALWFGEGFTSYYDDLAIRRAGLMDDTTYAGNIQGNVDAVTNAPGRRFFSPMEMAQQAPFVDAAASIDPTNRGNTFISYYTWGAAIGLGLDLTIRQKFPGKDLDGFMRTMWQQFGATTGVAIRRPYTVDDLQGTLGRYTGDTAFARDFFAKYIRGREIVDYPSLLAQAGFRVRRTDSTSAWAGIEPFRYDTAGFVIAQPTMIDTPLYKAGLESGDRVTSFDGKKITSAAEWDAALAARKPGDDVPIVFTQRGTRREGKVELTTAPWLTIETNEQAGLPVSDAQRAFRASWLGSKAGH
jgi:predicted metalloprotease with PDZ domain